jgi:hypothetical protein
MRSGSAIAIATGRSVMMLLSETDRTGALELDGAARFDPIGNRAKRSDKKSPAKRKPWR